MANVIWKKCIKLICSKFRIFGIITNKISTIHPDLKNKKIWDVFLLFITYLNFFIITIEICFFCQNNNEQTFASSNSFIYSLKTLNFLCYGIDIILNFFTGYYKNGTIIFDLSQIRKNYFRNLFIFDILAYVPNFVFVFENDLNNFSRKYVFLNILFFCVLGKFNFKLKDFRQFLIQQKEELESIFLISVLYLRTFFISHILACCWYLIGFYYNDDTTWLTTYHLEKVEWQHQYLNSLYWSLVTMVTVGYGDIVPQNDLEKIFCITTMLIGFCDFSKKFFFFFFFFFFYFY